VPPIRWIADAASIIHSPSAEIDWIRFSSLAKKHRVVLQAKKALSYLKDKYKLSVPESIMENISKTPISTMDILEYRYVMSDPETLSNTFLGALLGGGVTHFMEYRRIRDGNKDPSSISGLLKYLQYRMKKRNIYDLISYLALRALRITRRKLITGLKADNAE